MVFYAWEVLRTLIKIHTFMILRFPLFREPTSHIICYLGCLEHFATVFVGFFCQSFGTLFTIFIIYLNRNRRLIVYIFFLNVNFWASSIDLSVVIGLRIAPIVIVITFLILQILHFYLFNQFIFLKYILRYSNSFS